MVKTKTARGILLTSNLPQLQNLIKRDPESYKEEFLNQYNHYLSLLRLVQHSPLAFSASSTSSNNSNTAQSFKDLVTFVAQVAQCYPTETEGFAKGISDLILEDVKNIGIGGGEGGARGLGNEVRKAIVQNLVMLRNKDVISSIELLQTLFPLLPLITSATLRSFIRSQILTDIKTSNTPHKNHKLNRVVQALLFGMVERGMDAPVVGDKGRNNAGANKLKQGGGEAMWAITLIKELWKKQVWTDTKTVSIAARACSHPNVKVQSAGIHFFLGNDDEDDDESGDENEGPSIKKLEHQANIKKKTKAGERKMAKARVSATKKRKEKWAKEDNKVNFPALELLHDPQKFGEDLYENLQKHDKQYSLEHKILIMQILSRVMGAHKLCVLGFYTYIIKYLTYHQLQVTQILVSLAQSVHDLTPPDVLVPVVHKLAQEFVHPGVGAEVIAAGINSIREVSRRQPWCMEGEEDLLSDLIEYRKSKDKGVTTAARGLLQLFREVNPGLLKRRERGKAASLGLLDGQAPAFGHGNDAADGIEGLELLEEHLAQSRAEQGLDFDEERQENEDAEGWNDWEADSDSDSNSDSDEWERVNSDSDGDISFSDSDDDDDEKKRRSTKKNLKGKGKVVDGEEDEDIDMDAKSVMSEGAPSVAATDMSEGKKISLMAQQKILTPADFALLNELRIKAAEKAVEAGGGTAAKRKLAALEATKKSTTNADDHMFVDETAILGPRKKAKQDYEERMESIKKGREGREKFGSMKGKRKSANPSSSSNREKQRNKPLMMAVHSFRVKSKKTRSLRDKQIQLQKAADKQKKMKH